MSPWVGLCSSARRGAARGASGLARKIPPLWAALRRLPPTASASCDDLDSGLFDLDDRHCYCCMQFFDGAGGSEPALKDGRRFCSACSYQVHGKGKLGGQHPEFATTARPNDRCPAGCSGCTA
jgi:hypothetical protein